MKTKIVFDWKRFGFVAIIFLGIFVVMSFIEQSQKKEALIEDIENQLTQFEANQAELLTLSIKCERTLDAYYLFDALTRYKNETDEIKQCGILIEAYFELENRAIARGDTSYADIYEEQLKEVVEKKTKLENQ